MLSIVAKMPKKPLGWSHVCSNSRRRSATAEPGAPAGRASPSWPLGVGATAVMPAPPAPYPAPPPRSPQRLQVPGDPVQLVGPHRHRRHLAPRLVRLRVGDPAIEVAGAVGEDA